MSMTGTQTAAETRPLSLTTARAVAVVAALEVVRTLLGLVSQANAYRMQGMEFVPGAAGLAFGASFVVRAAAVVALAAGAVVVFRKRSPKVVVAGSLLALAGLVLLFLGDFLPFRAIQRAYLARHPVAVFLQFASLAVLPAAILVLARRRPAVPTEPESIGATPPPAPSPPRPPSPSRRADFPTDLSVLVDLCRAYAANDTEAIERLEPRATRIGQRLDREGGIAEMRRVFAQIPDMRGKRTLEMHWGGIGDWRG